MSWQPHTNEWYLSQLRKEQNKLRDIVYKTNLKNTTGIDLGGLGGVSGASTTGAVGISRFQPFQAVVTNIDQTGATTSYYDRIHATTVMMICKPAGSGNNPSATNPQIKWVDHTASDGQLLILSPQEGTTLTLEAGGNINISSNTTVSDDEMIYLLWLNEHPTTNSTAGSYNLLKMSSGGSGVALGDTPTWTGNHVFQEDVEIGTGTDDLLTIKSAIKGHTVDITDVGNTADTVFVDANLDMNTWNVYDLDSLYFSVGASSTSPAHNTDSYSIDAVDSGSNESLNFYTKSGKDFKWFEGGSEKFRYDGGDDELRMSVKIDMNQNKIENISDPVNNQDAVNKQWFNANQSGGISAGDDVTWTGDHLFRDTTSSGTPVKFQGNNVNTLQTVAEIGAYDEHLVKFIAILTGDTGRSISNPDGGANIQVPGSDPSISIQSALIMNTYTMYDLDTLVFSQAGSSTTPPPENDWVWIEANTGTSGSPVLTGMHYNVPSSKTHQFKINGVEEVTIDSDGIELGVDNFIVYNHAYSGSERTGGGGDTLHPDIWIRAKFGNSEIRIPAYYQ